MSSNDKRQIPMYAFQSIRWSRNALATALAALLWIGTGTCLHADTVPKVGYKASVNATAFVDPKALELLEHVKQRLRAIQTLSAVCTHTLQHHKGSARAQTTWIVRTGRIRLMRPNFSHVDTTLLYKQAGENLWHKTHYHTDASDGHKEWTVSYTDRNFRVGKAAANGHGLILRDIAPLDGCFDPEDFVLTKIQLLRQEDQLVKLAIGAPIRQNGTAYRLVRLVYRHVSSRVIETEDYFIGADLLIHRIHTSTSAGDTESEIVLSHIRVDRPMAKSSFAYRPPAGFQLHRNSEEPMMASLPNGTAAPDFTVQDVQGNRLRLEDLRGKWVVLDFWATWCGPCVQSFPGTNALATQYKDKNVVALAISVGDTPKVFESWLSWHKDYDAIHFAIDPAGIEGKGIDKRYKVGALPTQYLIDPTGKISASFVGHDNSSDKRLADAMKSMVSSPSANAPSASQSQTPPP